MDVQSQLEDAFEGQGRLPQHYAASDAEQEMMNVISPPRIKSPSRNIMPGVVGKHTLNGS